MEHLDENRGQLEAEEKKIIKIFKERQQEFETLTILQQLSKMEEYAEQIDFIK